MFSVHDAEIVQLSAVNHSRDDSFNSYILANAEINALASRTTGLAAHTS